MIRLRSAFEAWIGKADCAPTTSMAHEERLRALEIYFGDRAVEDFGGPAGGELAATFLRDQLSPDRKRRVGYAMARARLRTLWLVLASAGIKPEGWPIPRPGADGHVGRKRYVMGADAKRLAGPRKVKRPAKILPPTGPRWQATCVCATCGDEHHARASIPTVADLYAAKVATGTNADDQRRWENQIEPHYGHRPATSIEPQEIQDHLQRRRAERDERGVPSEGELQHEVGLVRRILNWGVDHGLVPHTRVAKLREVPRARVVTEILDPPDIASLAAAADDNKAVCILLHFQCLLSKAEAESLEWEDVIDDWTGLRVDGRAKPVVLESKTLRRRMQSLKAAREAAGDLSAKVLKGSNWRRDIPKLAFNVLGYSEINGESIGSAMFLRSGLYWAAEKSRGGYALEEAAGRRTPLRERRLVHTTTSEANALLEQHQAVGAR